MIKMKQCVASLLVALLLTALLSSCIVINTSSSESSSAQTAAQTSSAEASGDPTVTPTASAETPTVPTATPTVPTATPTASAETPDETPDNPVYGDGVSSVDLVAVVEGKLRPDGGGRFTEVSSLAIKTYIGLKNVLIGDGKLTDDFSLRYTAGVSFDEYGIMHFASGVAANIGAEAANAYIQSKAEDSLYRSYYPEEGYKLDDAEVRIFGNYVVYAILSGENRTALFETVAKVLTGEPETTPDGQFTCFLDEAGIISSASQANEIERQLKSLLDVYGCPVIIKTVNGQSAGSCENYAIQLANEYDYKYNKAIVLVLFDDIRRYQIELRGNEYAQKDIEKALDLLEDAILGHLRENEYYDAFKAFATESSDILYALKNGARL